MKKTILLCAVLLAFVANVSAQNIETAKDSVKQGMVYNTDGEDDDSFLFVEYETDPEFPGGLAALYKFLEDSVQYPEEARKEGISGRVYVTFTVEVDGSITNVMLLRDIGGGCGQEAVRVVKLMPRWEPGKYKNKPVAMNFNLPISFNLSNDE